MTTNDATRAALVEERTNVVRSIIASAMKWAAKNPHKRPDSAAFKDVLSQTATDTYRAAVYVDECTCDFCNERAVPEPDTIERAAKVLWDYRRRDTGWEPWEEMRDTRPDGSAVGSKSHYRDMALAALVVLATEQPAAERTYTLADMMREYQRGFRDSEAITEQFSAGDDLDAMLDSVPNMDVDSISGPTEIDGEAVPAVATVSVYDDVWREPSARKVGSYTGTGPTRIAAIQNAVETAKEHMR